VPERIGDLERHEAKIQKPIESIQVQLAILSHTFFMSTFTIWTNAFLTYPAEELLVRATSAHRLIIAGKTDHVLDVGTSDPRILEAEVVFGQPDPEAIGRSTKLRWLHLSSAGYARYDAPGTRDALKVRSVIMTNSSSVFDEPCAEHLMAWLLADARQLYRSFENQQGPRGWPQNELRQSMRLLVKETVLIVGYGAIGRRLAEFLTPYSVRVIGYRRTPQPAANIRVIGPAQLSSALAAADHVINILPDSPETQRFFDDKRLQQIKRGARYYNIGRGTTTDQEALARALKSGDILAAYLDVTDPEPLPPDHPLWSAPNCYITPHTGGGHASESLRIVEHFIDNLQRFERAEELINRVF
jgi:phosphoglycerate dehydrogenase-like enzyme